MTGRHAAAPSGAAARLGRAVAPAVTVYEITSVARPARTGTAADPGLLASGWAGRLITGRHRRTP